MKIKILLVGNESELLERNKTIWEKENEGIEVVTTTDPRDALKKLKNIKFDCVVSDYEMPKMNGLELLETLRNENDNTPFILISQDSEEEVAINALNLEVDGCIKKDFDPISQFEVITDKIFERPVV